MKKLWAKIILKLEKSIDRPWYLSVIALLSGFDLFVIFIPIDWILISSTLIRPKRWISLFISLAVGSAIGALVLGVLSHVYGESFLRLFMNDPLNSPQWIKSLDYIDRYGAWALAFISFGPIPQQPAVAICGMAGMSYFKIFFAVLVARLTKYGIFAWSSTHAPWVLRKLRIIKVEDLIGTQVALPQRESLSNR